MFVLENAKKVEKTFTRKSSGVRSQDFSGFKYRERMKGEEKTHGFTISSDVFESLGLSEGKGLVQINSQEEGKVTGVAVIVVPEEDAKFMRGDRHGSKSPVFKNTFLETSLKEAGIIEDGKIGVNQYMKIKYYADIAAADDFTEVKKGAGVPVYVIVPNEESSNEAEAEIEAEENVI